MKIYLIRHGQTTGDLEDRYGGDYDDHLSEKGRKQAQILAQKLKNKSIQIIFHSSRIRATETARIVNQELKLDLVVVKSLRERNNYGILTGLIKTEAKIRYPQEVEKLKVKLDHHVKSSEDYISFKKRVILAFEKITNSNFQSIAIISHGGPISCIIREIFKLGEFKFLGDCAVLEIEKSGNKFSLIRLENAALT